MKKRKYIRVVKSDLRVWERIAELMKTEKAGERSGELDALQDLFRNLCDYHFLSRIAMPGCRKCVLFKKDLCGAIGLRINRSQAYDIVWSSVKDGYMDAALSADNNLEEWLIPVSEKIAASRLFVDALREELRKLTERKAKNAKKRHG